MNKPKNKNSSHWISSYACCFIGVVLFTFALGVKDDKARIFSFSAGSFMCSGVSQIVRDLIDRGDQNDQL